MLFRSEQTQQVDGEMMRFCLRRSYIDEVPVSSEDALG